MMIFVFTSDISTFKHGEKFVCFSQQKLVDGDDFFFKEFKFYKFYFMNAFLYINLL